MTRTRLHDEVLRYFREDTLRGDAARDLFARAAAEAAVVDLGGFWFVAGSDDIRRLAADPRLVIAPPRFPDQAHEDGGGFVAFFTSSLSFRKRADHHRLRKVLASWFTPAGTARLDEDVRSIVAQLLDEVEPFETIDLATDIAAHLPMRVTARLMGAPRADWAVLEAQGEAMLARIATSFPGITPPATAPIDAQGMVELELYVGSLLRTATDPSTLAYTVRQAMDAGVLDVAEARGLLLLLFMTGIDTVAAAITNTVHAVLRRPAEWAAVAADPAYRAHVVAEALRLDTPLPFAARVAREDVELGTGVVRRGHVVALGYGAGNLDPRRYPDPLAWRPGARPPALSFGHGTYRCLGAALATQQISHVLGALATRGVEAAGDAVWRRDVSFHSVAHLPVRIGAAVAVGAA